MGFRKFTGVEKSEILSPDQHRAVEDELHRLGKTSAKDLSVEERESLNIALDEQK